MKGLRQNLLLLAILADNSPTANAGVSNHLKCAMKLNATMIERPNSSILLDRNGEPTDSRATAWGISYRLCMEFCTGPAKIDIYGSDYLAQHMTSWVLPWLALTAQLPYSASNKRSNIMAPLLALGSPALIVYTLALTVLNSRTIRRKFKNCLRRCKEINLPGLAEAIDSAQTIMVDLQHIPIQAYQGPQRAFSHLVVCPNTWIWRTNLKDEMSGTRKTWDFSLFANVAFVCIAQTLAVFDFFTSTTGTSNIGIGLAINSLWVWMVPVVFVGSVLGMRTTIRSISAAVDRLFNPVLGRETDGNEAVNGIRDRATSTGELQVWPNASHDLESQGKSPPGPDQQLNPLSTTFFGFTAAGFDIERETIFNYARAWSHMYVTEHVLHSFEHLVANQEHRRTVSGRKWENSSQRWKENLEGSPADKCRYISSARQDQPSISTQGPASLELLQNFMIAAFISMITQWGTTGAAIVIAYK